MERESRATIESFNFSVQATCVEAAPPWLTASKYWDKAVWRRDSAGKRGMGKDRKGLRGCRMLESAGSTI